MLLVNSLWRTIHSEFNMYIQNMHSQKVIHKRLIYRSTKLSMHITKYTTVASYVSPALLNTIPANMFYTQLQNYLFSKEIFNIIVFFTIFYLGPCISFIFHFRSCFFSVFYTFICHSFCVNFCIFV